MKQFVKKAVILAKHNDFIPSRNNTAVIKKFVRGRSDKYALRNIRGNRGLEKLYTYICQSHNSVIETFITHKKYNLLVKEKTETQILQAFKYYL